MDKSKDMNFLIITSRPVGFFASFIQVIESLELCEREKRIPIIFLRDNYLYWEENGWNGSRNPWEYYFHPVSEYSISDFTDTLISYLESSKLCEFNNTEIEPWTLSHESCSKEKNGKIILPSNVKISNFCPDKDATEKKIRTPHTRELKRYCFHSLIDKYIIIRKNIKKKIDNFIEDNFMGHRILGLHLRGKERADEIARFWKMKMLSPSFYFKEVDNYFKKYPNARLFIATDTKSLLKKVKERYGGKVIHYNAILSEDGQAPHKQFGGARVGEDVLIDCILLSKCDFLIHGISDVSFAATYFNKKLNHVNIQEKHKYRALIMFCFSPSCLYEFLIRGKLGTFLILRFPEALHKLKRIKKFLKRALA